MSSLGYQRIYRAIQAEAGMCVRARVPRRRRRPAERERPAHLRVPAPARRLPGHRALASPTSSSSPGSSQLLEARRHPRAARGARRAPPVHPRRRPAHLLQPAAARRRSPTPSSWARPSTLAVDVLRVAPRRAPRARPRSTRSPRIPHVFVPAHHGAELPAGRAVRRRAAPRVGADPHAAHRALEHVPHRDRARLLARLHLLRDAPLDQRRHAHRRRRRRSSSSSPTTRRRVGPRRRGGQRSPEDRRDRERARRARLRGRPLQPAARSARATSSSARSSSRGYRTLTTAMDGAERAHARARSSAARASATSNAPPSSRATHGMDRLKLYLMIGLPGETDDDIDECVAFTTELSKTHPRRARHRALLREAQHAARRRSRSPASTSSHAASIACAAASGARRRALDERASGRGSSTCSRRAARPRAARCSTPSTTAARFAAYQRAFARIEPSQPAPKTSLRVLGPEVAAG